MIKYRELKRRYDLDGPQKTTQHLREALAAKQLRPEHFSIRDLAEALIPDGREYVRLLDPAGDSLLRESIDAVDTTAFLNITGQLVFSKIMEGYQNEAFVLSKVIPAIPTRLSGEKIPGMTRVDPDDIDTIDEGMPYTHLGFGERYITTPDTVKRGFIVPVTREAVFFDRTHLILSRAAEVGEILGLNKEKRLVDLLIGTTNNYNENGTARDTYQAATPWINVVATNELIDWTDVDAAEQLLANMLDPDTSEPILISAKHVIVPPAKKHAANRIFGAHEIRYTASGAATETLAPNPMQAAYTLMVSALMYRRIIAAGVTAANADDWWFLGDFSKAFAYMENWPITVSQAPANSEADFNQDIVARFKASERGAAVVTEPRYVVKSYQA